MRLIPITGILIHFFLFWAIIFSCTHYLFHRFIPFSGGPRKCVGDQFALLEAVVALSVFIQQMDFKLVPDQKINMTTGATIHTTNVSNTTMKLPRLTSIPRFIIDSEQ